MKIPPHTEPHATAPRRYLTDHEVVRGYSCRVGGVPQIRDRLVGESEPLHDDRAGGGRGVSFLLPADGQHIHAVREVMLVSLLGAHNSGLH